MSQYKYESTITSPAGVQITVTIAVPAGPGLASFDGEYAEIAYMAANNAQKHCARKEIAEVPF